MTSNNIVLVDYDAVCAAGLGMPQIRDSLLNERTGLRPNSLAESSLPTFIGKIDALDEFSWSPELAPWQSRNNALIALALEQGSLMHTVGKLKSRYQPQRIGLVVGSSTSSIDRSELAYREARDDVLPAAFAQSKVLNPHAPTLFSAYLLGLDGPSMTINTACSSSAKVFACAKRWLDLDLVDAVVVGGADSLGLSVLHGFNSLQLVSQDYCRPFDHQRDGINLGEGAGFAVLTRQGEFDDELDIVLRGYGESSDAHHMSHPHPQGSGAALAVEGALSMAELSPQDIDYINLHGTASRANDEIEGNLIGRMFPATTLCSSTKGWMGHTLGAAGILEALLAVDTLVTGLVPGTLNYRDKDPDIALELLIKNRQQDVRQVMTNSFGFGGNNSCLIFAKSAA